MGSRWILVCTVPVCLASLCSSTVGEGDTQRGASQSGSRGSAGAEATVQADVSIFSEVKLEPGEEETFRFVAPEVPEGRDAVLTLSARLDTPKVAGHTSALRLVVNGTPVGGDRMLNRPLRVKARGGQVYSMAAGDSLTTYYSPDFESPDDHPHYGLTGGVKACRFELRVTDLLRPGENALVVENAARSGVTRVLVAANGWIELRPSPPPRKPRASAPKGPLPMIEPRTELRTDYGCAVLPDAKIEITVGGERFVVESRFSTPKPAWVDGTNAYFRHDRRIEKRPEAVVVFDTLTNLTSDHLAVMHEHDVALGDRLAGLWLAGLERPLGDRSASETSNPTTFAATAAAGLGLIALDDVFHVHVTSYAQEGRAGLADHHFVLRPGTAHTAEWAIVPADAPDYWRFINACRRLVDANFTLPGAFAFMRASHHTASWTDAEVRDFIRSKDARYVCAGLGSYQGRKAQGTAFQRMPQEPYREAFARRSRLVPGVWNLVYFHCFLDTTDEAPDRFADSRTLRAGGQQAVYREDYMRLFFPTQTNSYGPAIAKNVDIILDQIGAQGVYWDEHEYSRYVYHYGTPWDGVSGDIDREKMTIRGLKSSVTLVSEPWRVAMAKRILARGPLVGNGVPRTRAMAALEFPCFVETGSISNCTRAHLYSPIALGDHLTERSEEDAYGTMLAALDYGCVYHWYNDLNVRPSHHHLTRYMYPITPLELHEGYVIGRERIVTKTSGLFGFADVSQHEVRVFDHQGREVEDYPTPVVKRNGKTYTELRLPEDWSTAIVRRRDL